MLVIQDDMDGNNMEHLRASAHLQLPRFSVSVLHESSHNSDKALIVKSTGRGSAL